MRGCQKKVFEFYAPPALLRVRRFTAITLRCVEFEIVKGLVAWTVLLSNSLAFHACQSYLEPLFSAYVSDPF